MKPVWLIALSTFEDLPTFYHPPQENGMNVTIPNVDANTALPFCPLPSGKLTFYNVR